MKAIYFIQVQSYGAADFAFEKITWFSVTISQNTWDFSERTPHEGNPFIGSSTCNLKCDILNHSSKYD